MTRKRILVKIKELKNQIAKVQEEIEKEYSQVDDTPWEIPGLKEAEMRKALYEKKLTEYKYKLLKQREN